MNILELAEILGTTVMIFENKKPRSQSIRYAARLKGVEVLKEEPNTFAGGMGLGASPNEAIKNYIRQIRGRTLVFNVFDYKRRIYHKVPESLNHRQLPLNKHHELYKAVDEDMWFAIWYKEYDGSWYR